MTQNIENAEQIVSVSESDHKPMRKQNNNRTSLTIKLY